MAIVGIDGCSSGWIAVVIRGSEVSATFLESVDDLAAVIPDAEIVAVDIPIGLPHSGRRAADVEGKKRLGARGSTLFYVPIRRSLVASSPEEANLLTGKDGGRGVSRQTYSLFPKIREVDAWLPSAQCEVREVHPELSFAELNGRVISSPKKSWTGFNERRLALDSAGCLPSQLAEDAGRLASVDDVLDAAVAAWSAKRILEGRAYSIPGVPEVDSEGRRMAIWV